MKKHFNYIVAVAISTILSSCSAAYWSGSSFEGDDMYGVHAPAVASTVRYQSSTPEPVVQATTYAYQRPESYYQYQYVASDGEGEVVSYDPTTFSAELVDSTTTLVIDPKYVSSTYGVWEEEEVVASNVYVNVSYSYNPWWGYGYDPFYYDRWGYPFHYSHYYHHYYPYFPPFYGGWYGPVFGGGHPSYRPRPKQNIVTLPSSGGHTSSTRAPGSNSGSSSKSYRGQSVGTTTSGRFNRATTTTNSSRNSSTSSKSTSSSTSSSSSTKPSSSSSSSSSKSTVTYSAPVRPTITNSTSSSSRSVSTPTSVGSSSRTSSGGGSSSR